MSSKSFRFVLVSVLGVSVILAISIANLSTIDSLTAVFSEASGNAHLIVLSSTAGSEDIHAMVYPRDGDLTTGEPASVIVTLRNLADPEIGVDLDLDQALCITAIVSQIGPPTYNEIPYVV